ncbi:winged helix-turn-helix transcriptional regulator [Dyadobacter sp. NIV53]|uniref:winged helix-turn-helix transcriptional regulator n=1 Tax=Dyadobacter sp. NIV53 TaxID=2861765 RepID=UPI0038D35BEC
MFLVSFFTTKLFYRNYIFVIRYQKESNYFTGKVRYTPGTVPMRKRMPGLNEAMQLFCGKWIFCILLKLNDFGEMRFRDPQEPTTGISPKVLLKELQDLEGN